MNSIDSVRYQQQFLTQKDVKKANRKASAKANISILALESAATGGTLLLTSPIMKKMRKINDTLTPSQKNIVVTNIYDTLENSGLKAKGVQIINCTRPPISLDTIMFPKFLRKVIEASDPRTAIAKGYNACFDFSNNRILDNLDKFSLSVFHEMGHAHNFHNSKILKVLQKCNGYGPYVTTLVALSAIFTRKSKPEDNENNKLSVMQKVKNFVRDNAGKLTFLAMTPALIEEGVASFKGNKWAKKALDPTLAKKVFKVNNLGYLSYALSTAILVASTTLLVKLKDNLFEKYQNKALQSAAEKKMAKMNF